MRTIKFRVWDQDWGKMVYPIGIDWENQHAKDGITLYYWVRDSDKTSKKGIPGMKDYCNIMQFTGLLDKNGKEIYEGDVLWTYEHGIGNLNRTVVYDRGSFGVTHEHMIFDDLRGWKADYLEVIGNIHEQKVK